MEMEISIHSGQVPLAVAAQALRRKVSRATWQRAVDGAEALFAPAWPGMRIFGGGEQRALAAGAVLAYVAAGDPARLRALVALPHAELVAAVDQALAAAPDPDAAREWASLVQRAPMPAEAGACEWGPEQDLPDARDRLARVLSGETTF
ncbi:hypothetical protein [Allokutzneria oryzae]|uniref:DUF222 domain-containing protein n=1 Tax=Allokutzneria oryzae TaxID=1378989 RepID=A0ABV5ZZG2_9PSEU